MQTQLVVGGALLLIAAALYYYFVWRDSDEPEDPGEQEDLTLCEPNRLPTDMQCAERDDGATVFIPQGFRLATKDEVEEIGAECAVAQLPSSPAQFLQSEPPQLLESLDLRELGYHHHDPNYTSYEPVDDAALLALRGERGDSVYPGYTIVHLDRTAHVAVEQILLRRRGLMPQIPPGMVLHHSAGLDSDTPALFPREFETDLRKTRIPDEYLPALRNLIGPTRLNGNQCLYGVRTGYTPEPPNVLDRLQYGRSLYNETTSSDQLRSKIRGFSTGDNNTGQPQFYRGEIQADLLDDDTCQRKRPIQITLVEGITYGRAFA